MSELRLLLCILSFCSSTPRTGIRWSVRTIPSALTHRSWICATWVSCFVNLHSPGSLKKERKLRSLSFGYSGNRRQNWWSETRGGDAYGTTVLLGSWEAPWRGLPRVPCSLSVWRLRLPHVPSLQRQLLGKSLLNPVVPCFMVFRFFFFFKRSTVKKCQP